MSQKVVKFIIKLQLVILVIAFALAAALYTIPKTTFGAADNATLNVTILSVSEITVLPTALKWENVAPCWSGGTQLLDIKNTGSENVTNIYSYVGTLGNETSRPYGLTADNYAATGFIVVRNETDPPMYYAGRIEWNWTEDITNKDLSQVGGACTSGVGNCSWGFVRNTSYEYMWAFSNGTNGMCNDSENVSLGFESDIDNGTAASREPETDGVYGLGEDPDFGYFLVNRTGGHLLNNSCVAIEWNCTRMYIYKYDRRSSPAFDTCDYATYVQTSSLAPRQVHTLTLDAYIPCGTPEGELARGNIYVVAS